MSRDWLYLDVVRLKEEGTAGFTRGATPRERRCRGGSTSKEKLSRGRNHAADFDIADIPRSDYENSSHSGQSPLVHGRNIMRRAECPVDHEVHQSPGWMPTIKAIQAMSGLDCIRHWNGYCAPLLHVVRNSWIFSGSPSTSMTEPSPGSLGQRFAVFLGSREKGERRKHISHARDHFLPDVIRFEHEYQSCNPAHIWHAIMGTWYPSNL
jgi:hypothetical protein